MSSRVILKNGVSLQKRDYKTQWIFRAVLFVFVLITICPMLFVFLTSTKTTGEFYNNIWLLPEKFAWENYEYAWIIAQIGEYFGNSIIIVVTTVIITLILGAFAGYALAKLKILHADLIMLGIFLLTMLPSESVLMPTYIMISKFKITGTFLSIILPYTGWGMALTIYIYRNFFKTIPTEIIEAARIDGCSETRIFMQIVFPMMLPATATNAIFTFLGWWGEMLWASVELSTSALKTIPLGITAFVQSSGTNWGPLCAASCIVLIPVVVFFLFAQKYMVAGLTGGAVKG